MKMNTDINTLTKEAELMARTISIFWFFNSVEVMKKKGVTTDNIQDFIVSTWDRLNALKGKEEYASVFTKRLIDASVGEDENSAWSGLWNCIDDDECWVLVRDRLESNAGLPDPEGGHF